jgi:hypothetical protein
MADCCVEFSASNRRNDLCTSITEPLQKSWARNYPVTFLASESSPKHLHGFEARFDDGTVCSTGSNSTWVAMPSYVLNSNGFSDEDQIPPD